MNDTPEYSSTVMFGVLAFMNVMTILVWTEFLSGRDIMAPLSHGWKKFLIPTAFLLASYFTFVHKSRYQAIVEKFQNEDERSRQTGNLAATAYVVSSFALFVIGVNLLHP